LNTAARYLLHAQNKLQAVLDRETDHICAAAELVTESCAQGGKFYVFGSGHSHMVAEELYLRAGGLALVQAILPPELMLHEMPNKSTYLERLEGYAKAMIELYRVEEKDTIMVISNSGRNSVPVEMCLEAKAKGAKVIAMTSLRHAESCQSRHPSGKNIHQIADVTIDNCAESGDAAFRVEGLESCIGPTSSVTGTAIAQALVCQVVDNLIRDGVQPPVFKSSNADGGDEHNSRIFDKYYGYKK